MIGRPESAALRGMGHRPPSITIGRVALQAQRGTVALLCAMTGRRVALQAQRGTVALLCAMTGRAALQAVATFTAVVPPAASPLHIWQDGTTVRRALAAVVSHAAVARAAVVSLTPLLVAAMTARLEPATRRSAVVLAAGTLSNLT
jgi:hypothetical protein